MISTKHLTVGFTLASLLVSGSALPTLAQTLPNPPLSPSNTTSGYLLGVGDRVKLDLFNVPEYSGEYQVLVDGSLNLPIVGAVAVQGSTLEQASQAIAQRYQVLLRRSHATLTLLAARPITIAIAGEVRRPGSYTVPLERLGSPNLTQVLQLAGGVTGTADLRQVQIQRPRSRNQGMEQFSVDLWQLLRQGDLQQDVLLRDGDRVIIPTATAVNLTDARQLANVSFAAGGQDEPIQVAIVGEVNRPGPYTITPAAEGTETTAQIPTLTRAIQTAGGITQTADIRHIEVRRLTSSGATQRINIDFWNLLQAGDLSQDLPLQEGDTIVIPAAIALNSTEVTAIASASFSPDQMTVNVVGQVEQPGAVTLPPNTPLNQAILAAGGFNNRARRGSVELIRLNPDGTVSRQAIAVDFAQGINTANNPALRPNDTVVVGRSAIANLSDTLGTLLSPLSGVFGLFRLLGL